MFESADVSVSVQMGIIHVQSLKLRPLCVELFGANCRMPPTARDIQNLGY